MKKPIFDKYAVAVAKAFHLKLTSCLKSQREEIL